MILKALVLKKFEFDKGNCLFQPINRLYYLSNRPHFLWVYRRDNPVITHRVLLRRPEVTYGITGTALQWFRSYLTGRTQRVYINQTYSDDFPLPQGVPQGSCLGPLLFTMYASKLFDAVKNHLPNIHAYAHDTQIYLSFKPDSTAGNKMLSLLFKIALQILEVG